MVNEEKVEEGLTLKDIFQIIKKHIIVILICVIGFSALGYVYSKVKAPTYQANATVLVQYEGGDPNTAITTEYSYSKYISDTLVVFIKEEIVLQKVVDKARAAGYYADSELEDHQIMKSIASRISVSNEALILSISFVKSCSSSFVIFILGPTI